MVLVTGGTGLLGRVIALELVKRGKKVRACKRSGSDLADVRRSFKYYTSDADFFFDQIEWVDLDFEQHHSLNKALQDITDVYHCAAKISFDPKDRDEVLETGIMCTRNLLRVCLHMPVKKFLFVSSAATLRIDKNGIESQIKDNNSVKMYSPYVISKYICEKMVWSAYIEGLNAVIINPAMIIGSGNWDKKNNQLSDLFMKERIAFSGGTSCVDVRDVAKIAVMIMEKNIFGERFCLTSENVSYKELAFQIRDLAGLTKPMVLSKGLLKVMKYFRPVLKIFHHNARLLTDENIEFICDYQYHSNKKIKKVLSYNFRPVTESIKFHYGNYITDRSA